MSQATPGTGAKTSWCTRNDGVAVFTNTRDLEADEEGVTTTVFTSAEDFPWFTQYVALHGTVRASSKRDLVQFRR